MLRDATSTAAALAGYPPLDAPYSYAPPARRRPASDFLTLPGLADTVPAVGRIQFHTPEAVRSLILQQFEHRRLAAKDVRSTGDAAEMFGQAFFAWARRHLGALRRLSLQIHVMDADSVRNAIQHQYDHDDFKGESPLYLALGSEGEPIYNLKPAADRLRRAHPLLLGTALHLVEAASFRTVWIRTPHELLSHFAAWYWDGDESTTDQEAKESLADRFGEDEAEIEEFLPSVVWEDFCPAKLGLWTEKKGTRQIRRRPGLSSADLKSIAAQPDGRAKRLCAELIRLQSLLRGHRAKQLFDRCYSANPVYAACGLVWDHTDRVAQMYDDIYEHESQTGEATTFFGFVPFATDAGAMRQQYADWAYGFEMLSCIDRVLCHITTAD